MRTRRAAGQHRAVLRLQRDHLQAGLAALQRLADAADGAAGADAGDDDVHLAIGVVPDFFGGAAAMDVRIGRIFELLRDDGIGIFRRQLMGAGDGALHARGGGRQFDLRTQDHQHLAPFQRHAFRHHQDQAIAFGGGDEGQRDAGVARSRLDQRGLARGDDALRFHRLDHGDADAVLNRCEGIEEF